MSDEAAARGRSFVLRYYERRREVLTSIARDADPARLYERLAVAALPAFAQWLAVADTKGVVIFTRCDLDHEHRAESCARAVAPECDLAAEIRLAVAQTRDAVHPVSARPSRLVVAPLFVEDQGAGAVILARRDDDADFNEEDRGAIHDVVTALGVDLERLEAATELAR